MLQNDAWLQPALKKPPHVDQLFIVCALPLYHIFALTACFLLAMRAGGVNLLIPNPRDMPGFIKELMKYQVNSFPAVNTLYNGLLHTPGFDKVDFSKLKTSFGGGMAMQKAVAEKLAEDHRLRAVGRLRPVGDLADADLQSRRHRQVLRLDRHSGAIDLSLDPRRRRQRSAARPARRNLRQGSAGDGRLLEQAGRDREGDDGGRLLPHRRHRRDVGRTATPRSSTARRT